MPDPRLNLHQKESEFIEVPIVKKDERGVRHTPSQNDEASLP